MTKLHTSVDDGLEMTVAESDGVRNLGEWYCCVLWCKSLDVVQRYLSKAYFTCV